MFRDKLIDLGLLPIDLLLDLLVSRHDIFRRQGYLDVFGALEDSLQRIKVLRRNRIVPMVMASRARHGQPEEGSGRDIDPVVLVFSGRAQRIQAEAREQFFPILEG